MATDDPLLRRALHHYEASPADDVDPYLVDRVRDAAPRVGCQPNAAIVERQEAATRQLRRDLDRARASGLRWKTAAIISWITLAAALAGAGIRQAKAWETICGIAGCSTLQMYRSEIQDEQPYAGVLFEYDGTMRLIIGSNTWPAEERSVSIGLEVDEEPLSTTAGITRQGLVAVTITAADVGALMRGDRLRVSTLGAVYTMSLEGSAAGIEAAARATRAMIARGALPPAPTARDEAAP